MNNKIILSEDEENAFLDNSAAYDIIPSAIAMLNSKFELVYQNEAFKNLSISRNKQHSLISKNNIILTDADVVDSLKACVESKAVVKQKIEIPFNSTISLDISLQLAPVFNQNEAIIFIMLTIEDESIGSTFLQKIKHQQKFSKLVDQIEKLTKINQNNNELIKILLLKTPFPVLIIDENQQIMQSNEAAKNIYAMRSQDMIGLHCQTLFNCYQRSKSCPVVNSSDSIFEEQIQSSDNIEASKTFIRHSSIIKFNNKPALLEAFVDISEKVQYEHDLIEAKVSADLANISKSEFLSNMSHELRTPLHAILSFSRFGIKKIDSSHEKLLSYFEKIQVSGNTLLALLNDLLDLSKLEAGKMSLSFSAASLKECTLQVLDEFNELISEKNIVVAKSLSVGDSEVLFDRERIKQVVRNLIGNAIKFAPESGKIIISIYSRDDFLYFCIEDDGPGIPNDELEQVFDKFIQSSKTKTGAGGTGLGLSICKEIIAKHNGQIWAANSSQGGRLLFKLPRGN